MPQFLLRSFACAMPHLIEVTTVCNLEALVSNLMLLPHSSLCNGDSRRKKTRRYTGILFVVTEADSYPLHAPMHACCSANQKIKAHTPPVPP